MKKTIAFLFSAIMLLSLAGCAEKGGGNGSFSWQSNREQETATSYSVSPFLCTEPIETGNDEYITQQPLFADKEFFSFPRFMRASPVRKTHLSGAWKTAYTKSRFRAESRS